MEQSLPVAIQYDQWIIVGVWLVLGVICSIPASAIMGAKGQSAGAGFFLGFFLNFLGIGLAIICPASPERQAQAIARALSSVPLQTKPELTEPVQTKPLIPQISPQRQAEDPEAAQRSQGIADLIRDASKDRD